MNFFDPMGQVNSFMFGMGPAVLILVSLWSLFWKGLALWHSAQRGRHWWFAALLIINTVGVLEIVYLFGVAKLKTDQLFTTRVPNAPAPEKKA